MHPKLEEEIAASLEATTELIPLLPALLADLQALGCSPSDVVDLLRPLSLPGGSTRVVDLGCGKGALALAVAQELGFEVHGVDAFPPFIDAARRRARELGLSRCRFECCDLRQVLHRGASADVVVYASVGRILGNLAQTVGELRRSTRRGGFMVIEDAFLAKGTPAEVPGYEGYTPHDETVEELTSHGDELVEEVLSTAEEEREMNRKNTELIRQRAIALARERPEVATAVHGFVARQERETAILGSSVRSALWLLRRNPG